MIFIQLCFDVLQVENTFVHLNLIRKTEFHINRYHSAKSTSIPLATISKTYSFPQVNTLALDLQFLTNSFAFYYSGVVGVVAAELRVISVQECGIFLLESLTGTRTFPWEVGNPN